MTVRHLQFIMLLKIYRLHHHIKLVKYFSHGLYAIPTLLFLGVTNRL